MQRVPARVSASWRRLHPAVRVITVVYLVSRAVTVAAAWAVTVVQRANPDPSRAIPAPHKVGQVLATWDGNWYVRVALHGYPRFAPAGDFYAGTGTHVQNGLGFFPLYPLTIKVANWVSPFPAKVTAVILAMVFGYAATLLVWKLATDVFDADVGRRSALLFCCFPGAFVLSWAYSEALLIVLAAACLWWLHKERWLLAGVAASLGGATRSTGVLLVLCCAWAAAAAIWRRRDWKALIAPALSPIGVLLFFAYLQVHTHSWRTWFDVEKRGWGHRTDWGRRNLSTVGKFFTQPGANALIVTISLATLVAAALLALVIFRRRSRLPAPMLIFAAGTIALSFTSPEVQLNPRFVFTAFPLLMGFGAWVRESWMQALLLVGLGLMAVLTIIYGIRLFHPIVLFP